jgi:hypothetical protein
MTGSVNQSEQVPRPDFSLPGEARRFWRISDFERRQNPKKPKRANWTKLWADDLDSHEYLSLSATDRGVLADLQRLAGLLGGQVPADVKWLSRRLQVRANILGKSVANLFACGRLVEFVEDTKPNENSEFDEKRETQGQPTEDPSSLLSLSSGLQKDTTQLNSTTDPNETSDSEQISNPATPRKSEVSGSDHVRKSETSATPLKSEDLGPRMALDEMAYPGDGDDDIPW